MAPDASVFAAAGIDPNDPTLTEIPQDLYEPTSYLATKLSAAGLTQKAYDFDHCGAQAKSFGCSRHGKLPEIVKEIRFTCKQRFTKCCHERVENQRVEKHGWLIEAIKTMEPEPWARLSYATIRKPCPHLADGSIDVDGALGIAKMVTETLKELAQAHGRSYYIKTALQGFDRGSAVVKAIYWGTSYAPAEIRSALIARIRPDAVIEVRTEQNHHAEMLFRDLFQIIVPNDQGSQAKLEIAFHGLDMIFYSQRSDGSFPSRKIQGNESHESVQNDDTWEVGWIPRCQSCGRSADMISGMHPLTATREEIRSGRWSKIPQHRH